MKKFTTKLLMSIIAVAFAFVALGTSTYAWFSMNTTVSASGMTITAKSDTEFLVIVEGSTFNPAATSVEISSTHDAEELYPVAPATTLTAANVATPGSWHYAYSGANDQYAKKEGTEYVACTTLTDFVASETFSVGLNNKSGATVATKDLKLTSITIPANKGISCVVVCGNNIYTHDASNASLNQTLAAAASVTQTGLVITVYYYFNGEDSQVYTDNAANLTGSVTLTFGLRD
jgi:phage terminase large subunit-like protein